jgi:hypothetical protein
LESPLVQILFSGIHPLHATRSLPGTEVCLMLLCLAEPRWYQLLPQLVMQRHTEGAPSRRQRPLRMNLHSLACPPLAKSMSTKKLQPPCYGWCRASVDFLFVQNVYADLTDRSAPSADCLFALVFGTQLKHLRIMPHNPVYSPPVREQC